MSSPFELVHSSNCAIRRSGLEFAIVTERDAFDRLEVDWNDLFARAGRPEQLFQSFNWNWHWANTYLSGEQTGHPPVKLAILTARRGGALIMVWPLAVEKVRGITQAFWMGEPATQYGDVLIDTVPDRLEILERAWAYFMDNLDADLIRLRRVRADSLVASLLEKSGALASNRLTAPFLDLSRISTFAGYEQTFSAKSRRNRRRHQRRLDEQAKVSFKRLSAGRDARELCETGLRLKRQWVDARGLVSKSIGEDRLFRFFGDVAEAKSHPAGCIVTALCADDRPAAIEILFNCKGRIAVHVMAYDLAYDKLGVGALLFEQGIREAYAERATTIDLMAPGDAYKLDWADASVQVADWSEPLTLAGQAYVRGYLNFARTHIKSAAAALSPVWRRFSARSKPLPEADVRN